jgi:hypothetical protein
MTLAEIYAEFTPGSKGFVRAVQAHCGLDLSNEEIERLAAECPRAEDFEDAWKNENWWKGSANAS